jgi:SEC-C motif-containing protein
MPRVASLITPVWPRPQPQWLGLTLKSHTLQDNDHATVEFVARYKLNGRAFRLHELSRFVRVDGRWLYVDGDSRE